MKKFRQVEKIYKKINYVCAYSVANTSTSDVKLGCPPSENTYKIAFVILSSALSFIMCCCSVRFCLRRRIVIIKKR